MTFESFCFGAKHQKPGAVWYGGGESGDCKFCLFAPHLLITTPHQREDVSALDRFSVHRCPTRQVFSGTGLELVTRQATIRYLYNSATAATGEDSLPVSKLVLTENRRGVSDFSLTLQIV
ncbi:uncharacterized protein TNCV_1637461 [Trichonephila clavipes]|nr:uncharacterized protein TNCV_1637461 [Trichonephila clavipes]